MSSDFNVRHAAGYDQLMGRWSRRLAPLLIEFAGLAEGEQVLDVGCGTGSLTFTLADIPFLKRIEAVDLSPVFVEAARHRNSDPRVTIAQGDACALPFDDGAFDRSFACLVLHFIPEPGRAIAQMVRVTRPGGVVAATVWDHYGGMSAMRMFVDTVADTVAGGEALRAQYCFQPMTQPGELAAAFAAAGLHDIRETELAIRMDYQDFADYWTPIAAGEGPLGKFMLGLDDSQRQHASDAMHRAYLAGRPDGPRSFTSSAWACVGVV